MANYYDTKEEKKGKGKFVAGACALLAAAVAIFGLSQQDKEIKELKGELELLKDKPAIEQPIDDTTQPTNIKDIYEFEDVFNEEQVNDRVAEIYSEIKKVNPDYLITEEVIERDLKWISEGFVEDATIDEAGSMISSIEGIMNMEMEDATLYYHGKTDKIENKEVVDFSKYVEDDDLLAKTLITKIYELRKGMIQATSIKEAKEKAQEFTNLIGNSWFAKGWNNEINTLLLEKEGYIVLTTKYFLNTAMLATAIEGDLQYMCPPQTDKDYTISLEDMIKQLNEAKCLSDGQYANDFSAAMNGMITEMQSISEDEAEFNQYLEARLTLQRG